MRSKIVKELGFDEGDVRVDGVSECTDKDRKTGRDLLQRSEIEIKIRGIFLINERPSVILIRIYDNDDWSVKFSKHLINKLGLAESGSPASSKESTMIILKDIKNKIDNEENNFKDLVPEKSQELFR